MQRRQQRILLCILVALVASWILLSLLRMFKSSSSTNAPQFQQQADSHMTCILVHENRNINLASLVHTLSKFSFVNEIIIWYNNLHLNFGRNNIKGKDLFHDDFDHGAIPVRILNQPESNYQLAKYYACAVASNSLCYYQDETIQVPFLHALYAAFLNSNNAALLTVSHVEQYVQYAPYMFYHDVHKLHTKFVPYVHCTIYHCKC